MEQNTWVIVSTIGGGIAVVLWWAFKSLLFTEREKIKKLEWGAISTNNEIGLIKTNYLDRFAKVNDQIIKSKEEIINKIHSLELKLDKEEASLLIRTTAKAVADEINNLNKK